MKLLVVGTGGREHAIIRKLSESKEIEKIYCTVGNAGIAADAECVNIKPNEYQKILDFAKTEGIGFVFVAPDNPLVDGLVDMLDESGMPSFGPRKNAAAIEGSKVFSKNLMKKYGIPTAAYEIFDTPEKAEEYLRKPDTKFPAVIKADGLALGKGVIIAEDRDAALEAVKAIMRDSVFGASGNKIVIEEFLTGPEVSVLAVTDSHTLVPLTSAMDHKRALDGDSGLNTGGMGAIAPNPHYTQKIADECMEKIFLPTMRAMNAEGRPFKGCLYFGLMLTPKGPHVIEYNCRFGDPEAQVVLPLLKADLFEIAKAVYEERLADMKIEFNPGAAACVVLASGGYPESYKTGYEIFGLNSQGQLDGAEIIHAGTKLENGKVVTSGGRVLGVCAMGKNLGEALDKAYAACKKITFKDMHYRRDIGKK